MKKTLIMISFFLAFCVVLSVGKSPAKADELSESISEQLGKLDLTEFEEYYNSLDNIPDGNGIISIIEALLKGEYNQDYENIIEYVFEVMLNDIKSSLPSLISVLVIAIFCGIMQNMRSSFNSEGIADIIFFVCLLSIILLLSSQIVKFYNITQNTIENIAKLTEIMSPILLTLMAASGGSVSASIYSPTVTFLSGSVINVFGNIVMPMVGLVAIFSVLTNITPGIKLGKFTELFGGIIKWVIGIIITVFTIFLSVQGMTSATFDGISIKAAKYTISNSIPIVGGLLRDGFDLVVAGSILIKNSIGVASIITLFYTVLSPLLSMLAFSIILKFIAAVSESVSDVRISNICMSISKCLTYLIAILLAVALMLFITVLLIIFCANAFI